MKAPRPGHPAVAAALIAAFVLFAAPAAPAEDPLVRGLVRPGDGSPVEIAAGAPATHVVYFAVWCPPCVEELEALSELEARWGERGYRLVLIAVKHRHTAERLEEFRQGSEVPGELLFDVDGTAREALNAPDLPTHIVFDESGREVLRAESFDDGVADTIKALLEGNRPGSKK